MTATNPFGLPLELLDAAMARFAAAFGDDRRRDLEELQAAHPEFADALANLAASLFEADRALDDAFHFRASSTTPEFHGYRVVRKLGEGAFGVVYLGEQAEPVRREVAIKVLRPGAGDRGTLARFDAERRFLAKLRHPAIAQIFGAGLLADGRPWFVMEYVPGTPIAAYCDQSNMSVPQRVRLFARLCQGVQHAHEQGVVHRDLKPANILVVDVDGEAQPKIIDFGIARALERPEQSHEARTETGRVVGTPGYMSPEQMTGDLAAIDARTDVWSLGVVLYELLTGELPWGRNPSSTDSDPPRPSSRIRAPSRASATTAEQRGSRPRQLATQLRGELDWIVLKALSREPAARYATALDLASDVQRHLRGEPVRAGPPSWSYRLRKFGRRHRIALATLGFIAALGAGAVVVIGTYRDKALEQERMLGDAADRLLERANDRTLLDKPGAEPLRQALAADALRYSDELLRGHPEDPRGRARRAKTLRTLSQVALLLGRNEEAERCARAAAEDAEAVLAANDAEGETRQTLAAAERNIGSVIRDRGRLQEARAHFQRAVDLYERCRRDGDAGARAGLVRVLSDLCTTMDETGEAAAIDTLLATAADTQAAIMGDHPEAVFERDMGASIALQRVRLALRAGRIEEARALLVPVDGWVVERRGLLPGTFVRVHEAASNLAMATGEVTAVRLRLGQAIEAGREWLAIAPTSPRPYRILCRLLQQRWSMPPDGSDVDPTDDMREMVAVGEREVAAIPEDRDGSFAIVSGSLALFEALVVRGRRSDLAGLERLLRLASQHVSRSPGWVPEGAVRYNTLLVKGYLGLLADALGLADATEIWESVAGAVLDPAWTEDEQAANAQLFAMYEARIAARRLASGRSDDAKAMLDHLQELIAGREQQFPNDAPEIERLQVRLALERGDLASAAAIALRIPERGEGWRYADAAAGAMYEVWQAALRSKDPSADGHRDRCAELCSRAVDLLRAMPTGGDEVWTLIPLAKNRVRLALSLHDRGAALPDDLAPALETLKAWREEVHANLWDEALFRAGLALLAR
ncbi:MAG: serine/threonine-protein kinase [Planctomycetota bacterium]